MVRIRVDEEHIPHPDLGVALRFAAGCIRADQSVVPLADEAIALCRRFTEALPDDAAVAHLSGVVSFIHSNLEAAKAAFGRAVLAESGYSFAAEALADLVAGDPLWPGPNDYLAVLAKGRHAMIDHYAERMHVAVAANRSAEADRFAQRISAINNPYIASLHDIETCRAETAELTLTGELDAAVRRVHAQYQGYWNGLDEAAVVASTENYRARPDRRQLAGMVADLIEAAARRPLDVVELGCFGGYNLQNVHDRLSAETRAGVAFTGIEPAAAACRAGEGMSPAVRFIEGSHETLLSGGLDVPDRIDICLISRVLMILPPADVAAILKFLGPRTAMLVVCDDIANVAGAMPVIRGPKDFIVVHAFGKLLAQAGFSVAQVIPAEVPDRECTGFIVATGQAA